MCNQLIEVTQVMCPALVAALAVSFASSALAGARRRLARIAWPEAIAVEFRVRAAVREHGTARRSRRRGAQAAAPSAAPRAASRRRYTCMSACWKSLCVCVRSAGTSSWW